MKAATLCKLDAKWEHLGPVLLRAGPHGTWQSIGCFVVCLCWVLIAASLLGEAFRTNWWPIQNVTWPWRVAIAVTVLVSLFSIWLGLVHWILSRITCRLHALGVSQSGLLGERGFRFDQVASLTFYVRPPVAEFHDKTDCLGPELHCRFVPDPDTEQEPIAFLRDLKDFNEQRDMEKHRDRISRIIAARMARQLAGGTPVQWTREATIQSDGIVFRRDGPFRRRRKSVATLPWGEIINDKTYGEILKYKIEVSGLPNFVTRSRWDARPHKYTKGWLPYVILYSLLREIFNEDSDADLPGRNASLLFLLLDLEDEPNFWPGLYLFLAMVAQKREATERRY